MRFRPVFPVLLAMTCVAAGATTATAAGPAAVHEAATTKADQARVTSFWTPERMRSAVPIERLLKPKQRISAPVAAGKPSTVAPTAFPSGGGAWTGGGKIVATEGRVFFTYTGRTASCSGTAVTSGNKSTVVTAGHCV